MKTILFFLFLTIAAAVAVDSKDTKTEEVTKTKRHIDQHYQGFDGGHHGGHDSYSYGYQYGGPSQSHLVKNTHEYRQITKQVPVPVPRPYPVTVTKTVPVPQPYPVEVPKPYPVPVEVKVPYDVPKPYTVKVPQPVAIPVREHVPVEVPRPYPVEVTKHVQVPVEKKVYLKVPVHVPEPVPQPYPVHITSTEEVKVPTPVYVKERKYVHSYENSQPCDHPQPQIPHYFQSSFQNGQYGQYGQYGQGHGQYGLGHGHESHGVDLNTQYSHNHGVQQQSGDWSGLLKSYTPSNYLYKKQNTFGGDGDSSSAYSHNYNQVNSYTPTNTDFSQRRYDYGNDLSYQTSNNYETHSNTYGQEDSNGLLNSYIPSSQGGYNKKSW